MAQAHRIKTEPSALRANILNFLNGVLREIGFWLFAAVALGMMLALATFNPDDPAWTHTAQVARFHNLGGLVGAWFADVNLYFFGYPAYLLPLGVAFGGWRLFQRGGLLELDGEVVLLRVLGFIVTLTMACGLAALHLHPAPGTVPGAGSAGGLVGIHISQFLIKAFQFAGGNLFMLLLMLAGVTLATGLSWLTLFDGVGRVVFTLIEWIGALSVAPLRRSRIEPNADGEEAEPTAVEVEVAPAPAPAQSLSRPPLTHYLRQAMQWPLKWWRARQPDAAGSETTMTADPDDHWPPPVSSPVTLQKSGSAAPVVANAPTSRPAGRIEPMFDAPSDREAPSLPQERDLSGLDMLTLVPTAAPIRSAAAPPLTVPASPPKPAAKAGSARNDEATGNFNPQLTVIPRSAPSSPPSISSPPAAPLRNPPARSPYGLPPLNLLDPPQVNAAGYSAETLEQMSRRVEILLKHFGIEVTVVAVEPGPVITRFEIDPAPGVKVSQINNLAKDLARGLSVISVRVVEIIPGKSVIGLEIPNQKREIVYLREVLGAPIYTETASPLTLALGKDIGGNPMVANLGKMPHLLVAGTTGSGKSVAINAMLLSLLYKAPPSEVRLILVDPKMLELSVYEDIPHLLTPVVTDMKEAANALRWCVAEMEHRYRLMAALKVRNIAGFNRKIMDAQAVGDGIGNPLWRSDGVSAQAPLLQPLPFIVVVIDELADMMMVVGKKVEELIARLAQKARAAGIHLILATQRPSVDVITGLIKANIPTRIAFQVSSRIDSRTILDQMGAEQLLGHGDMLYLPPGAGLPQRVHGAFVDDHEVTRVVDYLRQTGAPEYRDDVLAGNGEDSESRDETENGGGRGGESDPLYDEAVRMVIESRRASVSGVQRRLRIGYNRAARLVEDMQSAGIVGPAQPNGSREVLAPPLR